MDVNIFNDELVTIIIQTAMELFQKVQELDAPRMYPGVIVNVVKHKKKIHIQDASIQYKRALAIVRAGLNKWTTLGRLYFLDLPPLIT